MARIREQVDIGAPPERVWAVVAEDVKNAPKWTTYMEKAEKLDGGPPGKGTLKGTWTYTYAPRKDGSTRLTYEMDYELTGLLRFAGGLLGPQYAAGIHNNMESLKRYIESGKGPKPK